MFVFRFYNGDRSFVEKEIFARDRKEAWIKAMDYMDDNDYVDCELV